MAVNYMHEGDRLVVTAPAAVTAGSVVIVGSIVGVALNTASSGQEVVIGRTGVWKLAKTTGESWTAGQKVYWNSSTGRATTTATGNTFIGHAVKAYASADSSAEVVLVPGGS